MSSESEMDTYYFGNIVPTWMEVEIKLNEVIIVPKAKIYKEKSVPGSLILVNQSGEEAQGLLMGRNFSMF